MKKNSIIIIVLLIVLGSVYIYRNYFRNEIVASLTVVMNDEGFVPENFTITKNTKVIWVNRGTISHWPASDFHPTHGIYPEFDPLEPVLPGQSWVFVFKKVGDWRYHDHLLPLIRGVINVSE